MKKKVKSQFLKRPFRFMLRFDKKELATFRANAKRSGLSQVEYGRRRILGIPIADIAEPQEARQEAAV